MQAPVAKAQMLIRRPVAEVFEAFVDPAVTTCFWFSKSTGKLTVGQTVRWDWEMYGVSTNVEVKALERNRRILIEWDGPDNATSVEWKFEPVSKDRTLVVIRNWGFHGDADKIVADAIDSTGGFSFVLAGLKAFAEHHIELNLVLDHQPATHAETAASQRTG
jgi:uncharacterized protein YndB with AHSA1/START domain